MARSSLSLRRVRRGDMLGIIWAVALSTAALAVIATGFFWYVGPQRERALRAELDAIVGVVRAQYHSRRGYRDVTRGTVCPQLPDAFRGKWCDGTPADGYEVAGVRLRWGVCAAARVVDDADWTCGDMDYGGGADYASYEELYGKSAAAKSRDDLLTWGSGRVGGSPQTVSLAALPAGLPEHLRGFGHAAGPLLLVHPDDAPGATPVLTASPRMPHAAHPSWHRAVVVLSARSVTSGPRRRRLDASALAQLRGSGEDFSALCRAVVAQGRGLPPAWLGVAVGWYPFHARLLSPPHRSGDHSWLRGHRGMGDFAMADAVPAAQRARVADHGLGTLLASASRRSSELRQRQYNENDAFGSYLRGEVGGIVLFGPDGLGELPCAQASGYAATVLPADRVSGLTSQFLGVSYRPDEYRGAGLDTWYDGGAPAVLAIYVDRPGP